MRIACIAAAVALASTASTARANCAMPVGYDVTEEPAGFVRICLRNFAGRTCPDQGLLRSRVDLRCEAAASPADPARCVEIKKLTSCDVEGCFFDECVPAGTYQYGLEEPYACVPAACGTAYFQEVTVVGAPAECGRITPVPEDAAAVPWSTEQLVCGYGGHDGPDDAGGCSTGGSVLGLNLAALVAGLGLWRLRAARESRA